MYLLIPWQITGWFCLNTN